MVAVPFLYLLPRDLGYYRTLLTTFGVKESFGPADFVVVLGRMVQLSDSRGAATYVPPPAAVFLAVFVCKGLCVPWS